MSAPRSPERERLAATIGRVAAAQAELDAIAAALARIGDPNVLWADIDAAEEAVADAAAAEPRRLLDEALGRPTGPSLAEATAARDALAAEQERRRAAWRLVQPERAAVEQRLESAQRARGEAIAAVVRGSPSADQLLNGLREARERVDHLEGLCGSVLLQCVDGWSRWDDRPLARAAAARSPDALAWGAALGALEADADAPLPAGPTPLALAA